MIYERLYAVLRFVAKKSDGYRRAKELARNGRCRNKKCVFQRFVFRYRRTARSDERRHGQDERIHRLPCNRGTCAVYVKQRQEILRRHLRLAP